MNWSRVQNYCFILRKICHKTCIFIFFGSNLYRRQPNYGDVSICAASRINVTKISMRSKQIMRATIKHYNNHLLFGFQSLWKTQFVFDVDNPCSEKLVFIDPNHNYHIRIYYISGDQRGHLRIIPVISIQASEFFIICRRRENICFVDRS